MVKKLASTVICDDELLWRLLCFYGFPYFYSMILSSTAQLDYIPRRIVSLVPSQTELLHWLGLEAETIAITKFCIHPESWFKSKQRIGGTKTINLEKIRALQPDLIMANKEENVKAQVEMLAEAFPVWVTDVNNLTQAYAMINDIGRLTGKEIQAAGLVSGITTKFNILAQQINAKNSLSAAYLIWREPYMTVGGDTFISAMMETAGFKNLFATDQRYPEITLAQLSSMNCRLLLLSSEPYPFKQKHIDEIQQELPGTKILLADGEMFSWYGSRLLTAADYFKGLIQKI